LCTRAVADAPTADELRGTLFNANQPATVRGDPGVGVVATVEHEGRAFIRFLAVDPDHRGRGHGHALVRAAEDDAKGLASIQTGADPPYYLWPGVPATETAMLCLFERHKYARVDTNFHMAVDLRGLPDDPGGHEVPGAAARDEVAAWMDANYANWTAEVLRALEHQTLLIARDRSGILGFCAYDVTRRGLVGPVGARLDLIGKGIGRPLLIGALHRMKAAGLDRVEVSWVGPIVPYARVGGVVSRVFFVFRKELKPRR
jgi:mycothiol synthase